MISFLKTYCWLIIPLFLIGGLNNHTASFKTIQHKVVVNHPGEKMPSTVFLNQEIDKNGLPVEYFMDVQSVICLEQVCKVIPVRIYWNNLGEYLRYELEKGATLEKYEDDFFDTEDYPKLQTILANTNSPFKDVYIDEILTVVDEHDEESDAVSGATALELDEKDTVPGAALTCYTLWHWANGEIVQKIKEITGRSVSNLQLQDFLVDKNKAYYHVALKDLERRNNYDKIVINTILKRTLEDETLLKATFSYLENSPSTIYFSTVKEIFIKGKTKQKLAVIRSLKSIKYNIDITYLESLSNEVSNLSSYQEISFFLDLLERKKAISTKVIENIFPVLKSEFIRARRVYWFLKNQKLSPSQKKILNDFYKKNKNK